MRAVGVIPARYRSSRFPGKPLALIAGKPLVQRVLERARAARSLSRLLVATDDERVRAAVESAGGEAMMTSPEHASGTDRLAEVAGRIPADAYVNVQGDEPLLDPLDIDRLVGCLAADRFVDMATLREPLPGAEAADDPNVVKVVCDAGGRALYFSRSRIPHVRAGAPAPGGRPAVESRLWFRHVGLYAYRGAFLREFASWRPGPLETAEGLEQLRALERGRTIRVLTVRGRYIGVDAPHDIAAVERALRDGP
ncbi:MAG: 3-deoxy-manno-octulosonate cytidylyltransferase [Acidobacteriota bacterium]